MKPLAQNTLIQGRYLVVHLIGKGGMGEVYLAVDQRLGSAVALKRTYFAGDEMLGNAFEREARTLARMRHPVLPKVSDHFSEGEEQYLVMEHIAGDDLAKRLEAAAKPFPVSWVMFWADQLLDALSYLHSHEPPIIHRDIKPQNLKLTDENHIILLDFGLSKTTTGQTHISNTGSTGSVVGYTPHYAPMEQIRGIGTNPKSDLYSLSATLYQLMTNTVPADALTRADAMLNGLADPIEPPHNINPEIPVAVSEVTLKAMEVSQEKRFSNAREMQKALRRAFTQMQEAMAAQTVAFNIGDVLPAEQPRVSSIEETRLVPSDPQISAPMPEDRPVDLDATIAFDPSTDQEKMQQAGIKTELFSRPPETNGQAMPMPEDVQLDGHNSEIHNSFVTVAAGAGTPVAAGMEIPIETEEAPAAVVAKPAEKKKGGGKAFAIVAGFLALLVVIAGAAAAGWYFYSNYAAANAVVEPSPSPSPEPTQQVAELPSPSPEASSEANASVETNTSVPSDSGPLGVETDSNSGRTETNSAPGRPGANATKTTPGRPTTTAPKATPKPRTNTGRGDILQ
ncbi:MAG TPA: serine/threonine-protein kinase [Pyrinomonadaceae bacterium]|nr:serine/threonine-protein kinase [Pyrinomonadaceae bacterium]